MIDVKSSNFTESPIASQTVSDKVYQWIKNAIINGDFKPGERIVQDDLTKYLRVSRTPVRDALQRLSTEKLVVITPFHGAEVFALSKKSLDEIYEVRILLESFAAQNACEYITFDEVAELERINNQIAENKFSHQQYMQLDREFHHLLCRTAKSDYIMEILTAAWDKSDPYKSIYFTLPASADHTIAEHAEIIDSIRSRDKAALERSIRLHLTDVVDTISRLSKAFKYNNI